jgi:hypothetical protein
MSKSMVPDDLVDFSAGIYEILKSHERTIYDLHVEIESLKNATVAGQHQEKFDARYHERPRGERCCRWRHQ